MSDYEKQLEARVNELQEKLTEAEEWVPRWVENHYGDLNFKNLHTNYGHIRNVQGVYQIAIEQRTNIDFFPTLQEAKDYIEAIARKKLNG